MRTLIVLGGDAPKKELLRTCAEEADLTIAADRGLEAFDAAGVEPNLLIGDMDSIEPDILARYEGKLEERKLNCIKDDTDGVDALDVALKRGATDITFLGALGGRLDHAIANVMLLGPRPSSGSQGAYPFGGRGDLARRWRNRSARNERGNHLPFAAWRGGRREH